MLRKAGYKPQALTVGPNSQSPMSVMLEPKPVARPTPRPQPQPLTLDQLRQQRDALIQQLTAQRDGVRGKGRMPYGEFRRRRAELLRQYRAMGVR